MARTKVFYLITGLHIGGAEKAFLELVQCLDRERFEPVVGTLVGGELIPDFQRHGVRVYNLAMRHKLDLRGGFRLWRALRQERPEVLHTRLIHADWLGRVVGRLCRVPVIVSTIPMVEDIRRRWFWSTVDRWTARANQAIIALSESVKRELIRVERLDPKKFRVIPNGVIDEGWQEPARGHAVRAALRLPAQTRLIGVVSRLETPRKGHHVFLRAFADLVGRHAQLHAVLIGDGPGRAALERHAAALGLDGRVTFAGTQRDIKAWLQALDLFVLPSLHEGFPMAVVEAMASGRPMVATAVAGVPDLVVDGETGRLVPPGDAVALAKAIEDLVTDPERARRFGDAARQRFVQHFEMRQVARQIEQLYGQLLAGACSGVRRLKLLEVVTSFDAGGVTTYLRQLLTGISRDRVEVLLASGPDDFQAEAVADLGIPYHRVPLTKPVHPLKDLAALWQLCRLIRRERVDIVHTHMAKSDALAGLAARLCGVRRIVSTAHGPLRLTSGPSFAQAFFDGLEWLVYRTLPTRVISVSAATTTELLRKRKVRPEQVVTIPNGLAVADAPCETTRQRVRRQLGLTEHQPVFVTVGRLKAPKTPAVLIESVAKLLADWPTLVCVLVGDGPERPALDALVRRHRLEQSIRFLGVRHDVPELLAAADLFALSTYSEGMPYSVLEAMAAGRAVVTTRLHGLAELIEHGTTGWLVPENTAAEYARAIDTLLREPDLRQRLGQAARERVRTQHRLADHVEATAQVLTASGQARARQAAPSALQRLRLYAREEGRGQTCRRLLGVCARPWYRRERLWFLTRPVTDPMPRVRLFGSFRIRVAVPGDFDALVSLGFDDAAELAARLSSAHEVCFIAERDGRVVAFQWVALGPHELWMDPIERSIRLAATEAHLVRCRALRAVRGRGVVPAIEAEVVRWLATRGYRTISTNISADHALSLSTFEKLGFKKRLRISLRRTGPFARWSCDRPRMPMSSPLHARFLAKHPA